MEIPKKIYTLNEIYNIARKTMNAQEFFRLYCCKVDCRSCKIINICGDFSKVRTNSFNMKLLVKKFPSCLLKEK